MPSISPPFSLLTQEDASSREARKLLSLLAKSPYPPCSDADVVYFREMLFRSDYLRDVGRMHSGKIQCSATAGHPQRAIGQFLPGSTQQDGSVVYSNLVPIHDETLKRDGIQLGNAFVCSAPESPRLSDLFP
jgi:sensor c-di-GMP phosphodiesterase-like protein